MSWCQYSTEVPDKDFEAFKDALSALLEVPAAAVKNGVSELIQPDGFISIAHDTSNKFLAARWLKNNQCHELFFVKPATKRARIGYSCLGPTLKAIPNPLLLWLDADRHKVDKLPSFTTLSGLLTSQGAAVRDVGTHERQLEADSEYLKQLLAEQSDLLRQTQAQLRNARQRQVLVAAGADDLPYPPAADTWDLVELPEWCAEHESEIVVLSRARNGAKKSRYEDPSLIRTALELLAGPYRDMRCGRLSLEQFEAHMLPTGLRFEGSVSPNIAGEQGDTYFVNWAGRRRFLEFHLLKGGGRDERFCFRLYFFWDEESQRAVVGSLPAHLANSLS